MATILSNSNPSSRTPFFQKIDINSGWSVTLVILITAIGIIGYFWTRNVPAEAAATVGAGTHTYETQSAPKPHTLSAF